MATLTKEQYERIYYYLRLTRMLEERLSALAVQGKTIGSFFSSLGQEATAVGCASALEPELGDIAAPLLRDLGALLVMGARPVEVFQQYMARNGPSRGRELNVHFGAPERNFIGPVSMLGEMIPLMAGVALSNKLQRKPGVTLCFIGDGGSSTGPTHEGLNFAAVLDLPFVLVIENNGFAYSTPTAEQSRLTRYADRALAYGIPGITVDGNDVMEMYDVTSAAAARARAGMGPTLIEAVTFRMKGHAQHDNRAYVPDDMLAEWNQKDPIARFERFLTENGISSPVELEAVCDSIRAELEQAEDDAGETPLPDPASASTGVFEDSTTPRAPWLAAFV